MEKLGVRLFAAPEIIRGEPKQENHNRDGQVAKLPRINEGQKHGVADDRGGDNYEDQRRPGIAGHTVGNWQAF